MQKRKIKYIPQVERVRKNFTFFLKNIQHHLRFFPHDGALRRRQTPTDLSFDRLPLTVDDGVRGDDAVGAGVGLHHLELHRPHAAPDQEDVICRHTRMKTFSTHTDAQ